MWKNGVIESCRYLADIRPFREMLIWGLSQIGSLLPMRKIGETDSLIYFYHPQPVYPIYILLLPKKDIRDLSRIDLGEGEFLWNLFVTVRELIEDLHLEVGGYRLIVDGGDYQEFPQLHFHLISGE
jgi:histidine triad (HIT) family protein